MVKSPINERLSRGFHMESHGERTNFIARSPRSPSLYRYMSLYLDIAVWFFATVFTASHCRCKRGFILSHQKGPHILVPQLSASLPCPPSPAAGLQRIRASNCICAAAQASPQAGRAHAPHQGFRPALCRARDALFIVVPPCHPRTG